MLGTFVVRLSSSFGRLLYRVYLVCRLVGGLSILMNRQYHNSCPLNVSLCFILFTLCSYSNSAFRQHC